jgi:hypothetical protein
MPFFTLTVGRKYTKTNLFLKMPDFSCLSPRRQCGKENAQKQIYF